MYIFFFFKPKLEAPREAELFVLFDITSSAPRRMSDVSRYSINIFK